MTYANQQRLSAWRTDHQQRKREREQLDDYGWVMSLDTVRTPEEILLVKQRFERLERQIDKLQPRLGRVMRLRLGINCKVHSLGEIAEQYGVTRSRVQQMEYKGLRILRRKIFIEEKPEEYRREQANIAKAYRERIAAEKAAEAAHAEARKREYEADWSPPATETPVGVFRARSEDGRFKPMRHERTILDDIVTEQQRALQLEREYGRWAREREAWLNSPMPSWVVDEPPPTYQYKLRKVPIKRDWLHVATEGFSDGA